MESYVFTGVIEVFGGLSSASVRMCQKKGFAFAVCEGCRELASEVGRVSERTRFNRSSRSIWARSRALRYNAPGAGLGCSSSNEDVMSIARRECRADFPIVSLQLLDPLEWKLAVCGGFIRGEAVESRYHQRLKAYVRMS